MRLPWGHPLAILQELVEYKLLRGSTSSSECPLKCVHFVVFIYIIRDLPAFYLKQRFRTVYTTAINSLLLWVRQIPPTTALHVSLIYGSKVPSCLSLSHPSGFIPPDFPVKILSLTVATQLDRSWEKWRSVTESQGGEEYPTNNNKK